MKKKTIGYWVATAMVAFVLLSGGVADVTHQRYTVEGMVHLGYPLYFITILGIWKLLGGTVLLLPGFPRIKEWAYAGAVFNLTGAAASHAVCGVDLRHILVPFGFALVAMVSWALRPQNRTLGILLSTKAQT